MLDFLLILGQIPGTDFQLTFSEILLASLVILGFVYWRAHKLPRLVRETPVIRLSSLPNYEQLTLKLPGLDLEEVSPAAELTPHKDGVHPVDTWLLWLDRHWRIIR